MRDARTRVFAAALMLSAVVVPPRVLVGRRLLSAAGAGSRTSVDR